MICDLTAEVWVPFIMAEWMSDWSARQSLEDKIKGMSCNSDGEVVRIERENVLLTIKCKDGKWDVPFEVNEGLLNGFCAGKNDGDMVENWKGSGCDYVLCKLDENGEMKEHCVKNYGDYHEYKDNC